MSARVTEADMDAAASYIGYSWSALGPDSPLARAFARHREQATAELVETLRGLVAAVNTNELAAAMACHDVVAFANVEDALKPALAILSRHEPTDAELVDQVCRGMEEVSKPLEGRDGCP